MKTIATIEPLSSASTPTAIPGVDAGQLAQVGLVAVAGLLIIRTFLAQHTAQVSDSWKMLENLVESQQRTSEILAETNRELSLRLARVHERLEHIERWLSDHEGLK